MVVFFSGTGNSKHIAKIVAELVVGQERRDPSREPSDLPRVRRRTATEGMGDATARNRRHAGARNAQAADQEKDEIVTERKRRKAPDGSLHRPAEPAVERAVGRFLPYAEFGKPRFHVSEHDAFPLPIFPQDTIIQETGKKIKGKTPPPRRKDKSLQPVVSRLRSKHISRTARHRLTSKYCALRGTAQFDMCFALDMPQAARYAAGAPAPARRERIPLVRGANTSNASLRAYIESRLRDISN